MSRVAHAVLNLEQSLLSHHLKVLRDTGFVQAVRDGKAVLYTLAPLCKEPKLAELLIWDVACFPLTNIQRRISNNPCLNFDHNSTTYNFKFPL